MSGNKSITTACYLLMVFSALVMLAGLIVLTSTACRKTVHVLILVSVIFWCPMMLDRLIGGSVSYVAITGQPMYLMVLRLFEEG